MIMAVFNNTLAGAAGQAGGAGGYQIERSVRFNDDDGASLTRTFSSGNTGVWTWSFWVKRSSSFTVSQALFSAPGYVIFGFEATGELRYTVAGGSSIKTAAVYEDPNAWYHITLVADSGLATADQVKLYVNGEQVTDFISSTFSGPGSFINSAVEHSIGKYSTSSRHLDGYLADIHFIDGQALTPTDFGEYDDNGVWQPKAYSGTYGTNGFHLDFSDNSSAAALGYDAAGSNDWTVNNISVAAGSGNDSLFDSPQNGAQTDTGAGGEVSGNYATMNPLATGNNITLSNGNLQSSKATVAGHTWTKSTIGMKSGKWYAEITVDSASGVNAIGLTNYPSKHTGWIGADGSAVDQFNMIYYNGSIRQIFDGNVATTNSISGGQWTVGDILQIAYDADNDKAWFGINNTWYQANGSSTTLSAVEAGNDATFVNFMYDSEYFFTTDNHDAGFTYNFGQRPFAYTAPSEFKALCTANLDDPTIADGSTEMDVSLYTGNGATGGATQTISGLDFSPDLVWVKARDSSTSYHVLFDKVRGEHLAIRSENNAAEADYDPNGVSAFGTNSFSVTDDATGGYSVNGPSGGTYSGNGTYVAYTWDAGGTTDTNNTAGTITPTGVMANPSAGFSIVSYTGDGNASGTIGHGLNAAPEFIIVKNRDVADEGRVYHVGTDATSPENYFLKLFAGSTGTAARSDVGAVWNDTAPTSSVFSVGTEDNVNASTEDYIAYCWAPVEGYSAFGSYEGNGLADGPFVYTGFRPAFLLLKSVDVTGGWAVIDSTRDPMNAADELLQADKSAAETTSSVHVVDMLSNGFKLRGTGGSDPAINPTSTVIYAAFAEHPFKTARAR